MTPCVYPMIPITVSFFTGKAGQGRLRVFLMAVSYVLGMAVTYTVLGLLAALAGKELGAWMTSPVVIHGVAVILVASASTR